MRYFCLGSFFIILQSCFTPFQTAQLAQTIDPGITEFGWDAGPISADFHGRFGIAKGLDAGFSVLPNFFTLDYGIPGVSVDLKKTIYISPSGKFGLSTGLGYGIGSDWMVEHNIAIDEAGSEDGGTWNVHFSHPANDFILPFYMTFGSPGKGGFFMNPFAYYRLNHFRPDGYVYRQNELYPGASAGFYITHPKYHHRFSTSFTYIYYDRHIGTRYKSYMQLTFGFDWTLKGKNNK